MIQYLTADEVLESKQFMSDNTDIYMIIPIYIKYIYTQRHSVKQLMFVQHKVFSYYCGSKTKIMERFTMQIRFVVIQIQSQGLEVINMHLVVIQVTLFTFILHLSFILALSDSIIIE